MPHGAARWPAPVSTCCKTPLSVKTCHGTLPQGDHCLGWAPDRRVGHKDTAVDVLDVEWDEAQRADRGGGCKCGGAEAHRSEGAVEYVDAAGRIIDGVQLGRSRIDGQPGVESARRRYLGKGRRADVPGRDGAVQVGKDEVSGSALPAVSY